MLSQEHPPVAGNSGGVEPATSAFTEPRASRYTTNCIDPVIPGGLEPPISSASGRRRRRWATGSLRVRNGEFGMRSVGRFRLRTPSSALPRPGFEPGTPRSKRGMMSVSPPGRSPLLLQLHTPSSALEVPRPGFEPGTSPSESDMIPLQHQGSTPAARRAASERKGRESNPHALSGGTLAGCLRYRFRTPFRFSDPDGRGRRGKASAGPAEPAAPALDPEAGASRRSSVESRGVEPRRRACKAQLQPAGVPVFRRQETGNRTVRRIPA